MTVRSSTSLSPHTAPSLQEPALPITLIPTPTFPDELQLTIPPFPSPHRCRRGGLHCRCLFLLVGDHRRRGLVFQSAGVLIMWGQGVRTVGVYHLLVVRISTSVNGNGNGNRSLTQEFKTTCWYETTAPHNIGSRMEWPTAGFTLKTAK